MSKTKYLFVLIIFAVMLIVPISRASASTKTVELSTTPALDDPIYDGGTKVSDVGVAITAPLNSTTTPIDSEATAHSPKGYTWRVTIPDLCDGAQITGLRVKTNSHAENESPNSGVFFLAYDVGTNRIFSHYSVNDGKGEDTNSWMPTLTGIVAPSIDRGTGDGTTYFPASLGANGPLDATWDLSSTVVGNQLGIYVQHWITSNTATIQTTIQSVELSYDDSNCPNPSQTIANAVSGSPITFTMPKESSAMAINVRKETDLSIADPFYEYPNGLVDFSFDTTQTDNEVSLVFVTDKLPSQVVARKHNPSNKAFFTIPNANISETTYNNQHALKVTYTITDNGDLDLNPATGKINDPVGLAVQTTTVPNTGLERYWLLNLRN